MAVAKSYETMEICGEPFKEDGKMYVKVIGPCKRCGGSGHYSYNPLDGTTCYGCHGSGKQSLTVRWYTDAQRAAMDKAAEKRAAQKAIKDEERRVKFAARNAFGFGPDGYIILVYGDNDVIKEWRDNLPKHTVWYNEIFGWFIPSTKMFDDIEFPENIKTKYFEWNLIHNPDDPEDLEMIDHAEARKIAQSFTAIESKSQWQGTVGEWLAPLEVKVVKNITLNGQYGEAHMHIMQDADENVYVWTTGSKNFPVDKELKLKMKVKEHSEYNGVKQTIVWYCKEAK